MLKTALLFAGASLILALFAPDLLLSLQGRPSHVEIQGVAASGISPSALPSTSPHEQSLAADRGGQYSVNALVGGQSVHMLVDTGATMVVISAALADRIGLSAASGRKWRVHTANGETIATETMLPSVDLGSIYMTNVPALIADRSAGEVNLLGANFLSRLASVEQRDRTMTLRQ